MSEIKWIKLTVNVFDDEKFDAIKTLPDSNDIQLAWVKLLCLAGTCNENGFLMLTREIPYTDEMLAKRFGMDVGVIQRAMKIFQQLRMIEVIDNIYMVSNWLKYQSGDRLEELQQKHRDAQRRYREKQRQLLETSQNSDITGDITSDITDDIIPSISNSISNSLYIKDNKDIEDIYNGDPPCDYKKPKKKDVDEFFAEIWKAYPKKKGKGAVSDARKRKLYEEVGLEQMLRCIDRYKNDSVGTSEQYVMYGSTFFNSGYVDYLDDNYGEQSADVEDNLPFM